ncbi:MAG TPA: bifunctional diaminohydroxyphosphoribosylaminopyrimidine deaminase/5-amino-6-(5-phosphoribosylamino)uracil reductase RibD, partial [Ignavibacteria bacterium]|nr:bifunctional diaminohydroxyphosphoribosylaminopyrimidine deaminase/5-amino-6-(5-phosphoribosylamino)uracil reductase RibD [Ignavibacteria bacterium]
EAIYSAKKKISNLKGSELYVNLEPCSHFGKTPPCVDLLIKENIKKVFIGIKDPDKKVNGKGIKKLIDAGIDVKVGILKEKCKTLNKFFISFIKNKRPYVTLKIAQSIDGNIALKNFKSKWITNEKSRYFVHQMRSVYDCVLVGRNTVEKDNPELKVNIPKERDPFRVILDSNSKLSPNLKVFKNNFDGKTIRFSNIKSNRDYDYYLKSHRNKFKIKDVLDMLYKLDFNSVIVEGGSKTFSKFLKTGLFDDIYFFVSSKILGNGIRTFNDYSFDSLADANNLKIKSVKQFENDVLILCNK